MNTNSCFSQLSDSEICTLIGKRIELIRLDKRISQQAIAEALNISVKTYRSTIKGKGRFIIFVGILRILDELVLLEDFIPSYSPDSLLHNI